MTFSSVATKIRKGFPCKGCFSTEGVLETGFCPHIINKATIAKLRQCGEENLLQSRLKINKRKHGKPNLPPKTMK
jgi:hypothetical protein